MLYGGVSIILINHLAIVQNSKNRGNINGDRNIPYIIGAGIALLSVPIKIGYSNKIKRAVSIMNEEEAKKKSTGFNVESSSLLFNSNGIGIALNFLDSNVEHFSFFKNIIIKI